MALPEPICQALHGLDKRALMMVCAQSIELLHGLVAPQREHRRASHRRKRERQKERKRAQLIGDPPTQAA